MQDALTEITVLLAREDNLSEDVIEIMDHILESQWNIADPYVRAMIIQDAAINAGLINQEDID